MSRVGSLVRWQSKLSRIRRSFYFAVDRARLRGSRIRARLQGRQEALAPMAAQPASAPVANALEVDLADDVFPAFHGEDSPKVSIVIPIYNQLAHTRRCLHSLSRAGANCSFEVVVVDDGSSDGSAEWLAGCSQVRVHRMPQNSGFVHACNAGADIARGLYLIFLNNDTQVSAGWLDTLIGTFDDVPRCGLVGVKLVYPDGSLQEAGGIVFDDGNACNYGRGGDPNAPPFDFVREADYCSGACIALRAELFHSIGGFDTRYAPAYYEDTDLAFEVRARGLQVIYQPRVTVIHHEGTTAGTNVASGTKRFQQINRGKFVAKQGPALANQPTVRDFAQSPRRCATHWRGAQVLVADLDYPHGDRDSGSLRMLSILLLLREMGCHVLFWATGASTPDDDARTLERHGIELVVAPTREEALRWWHDNGGQLDMVLLSRLPVAAGHVRSARRYAAQAMCVFDTVDLHFLRIARGAALTGGDKAAAWAEQVRDTELALMRKADLTLVVSDYEKDLLRELLPNIEVQVLSNIHPVQGRKTGFAQREGLLFLGNFEHEPNVDAVRWLVSEIMPLVVARLPGATLHIVGYAGDKVLHGMASEHVVIHGHVPDIEPVLQESRIALAPLRYGAGVKGKINMAMSHGVPVVSTAIGAEGMGLVDGLDVLIADTAELFADAIVRLYDDEKSWVELSDSGLANISRHFSPEVARSQLERMLAPVAVSARHQLSR